MENFVEMVAVGVGDEYLSELIAPHNLYNLLHPGSIEFVENVVEQEDRRCTAIGLFEEIKLRQLESDGKRLVLPLAPLLLHGIPL